MNQLRIVIIFAITLSTAIQLAIAQDKFCSAVFQPWKYIDTNNFLVPFCIYRKDGPNRFDCDPDQVSIERLTSDITVITCTNKTKRQYNHRYRVISSPSGYLEKIEQYSISDNPKIPDRLLTTISFSRYKDECIPDKVVQHVGATNVEIANIEFCEYNTAFLRSITKKIPDWRPDHCLDSDKLARDQALTDLCGIATKRFHTMLTKFYQDAEADKKTVCFGCDLNELGSATVSDSEKMAEVTRKKQIPPLTPNLPIKEIMNRADEAYTQCGFKYVMDVYASKQAERMEEEKQKAEGTKTKDQ